MTFHGSLIKVHRYWKWYQPVSYLSVLIRLFTRSYWNHTAIGVLVDGKECVLESNHKGVVIEPWSVWKNKYGKKTFEITLTNKKLNKYFFLDWVGKPYDYASVFLYHPIYQITGIWLGKSTVEGSEKTYCTEIYSYLHGLENPERLTTGDLERMGL